MIKPYNCNPPKCTPLYDFELPLLACTKIVEITVVLISQNKYFVFSMLYLKTPLKPINKNILRITSIRVLCVGNTPEIK